MKSYEEDIWEMLCKADPFTRRYIMDKFNILGEGALDDMPCQELSRYDHRSDSWVLEEREES